MCVQSMFTQGGVIVLQSVASGSTLCIYDGQVSGKGIRDAYCKWKQQNSNNIVCLFIILCIIIMLM